MHAFALSIVSCALLLASCDSGAGQQTNSDTGSRDTAIMDATPADSRPSVDTQTTDAQLTDAQQTDAQQTDAQQTDAQQTDARVDTSTSHDSGDVDASGDACVRPSWDTADTNRTCPIGGVPCSSPYMCITLSRFVAEYRCLVACSTDCDCPSTERCAPVGDNTGTRHFCLAN